MNGTIHVSLSLVLFLIRPRRKIYVNCKDSRLLFFKIFVLAILIFFSIFWFFSNFVFEIRNFFESIFFKYYYNFFLKSILNSTPYLYHSNINTKYRLVNYMYKIVFFISLMKYFGRFDLYAIFMIKTFSAILWNISNYICKNLLLIIELLLKIYWIMVLFIYNYI